MKKIRIKKPTIIIMIVLVIGISIVSTVFKGNILYFIGNVYESLGKQDIADTYYKKVIDSNKSNKLSVEAEIKRLTNILSEKDLSYMKMVVIGQGFSSSGGSTISIESLKKINDEHEKIITNIEKDDRVALYEIYVSVMNWFAGEKEKALNIIENIDYIKDDELEIYREINISAMKIELTEYEEGEKLIYSSLRNKNFNRHKQVMLALIHFMRGEDAAKILEYKPQNIRYENGQIVSTNNEKDNNTINEKKYILSIFENFIEAEYYIKEDKKHKYSGNSSIKGKVTYNGDPVRGVMVYLKTGSGISSGGVFSDNSCSGFNYGITDQNGEYTIKNIPNKEYGFAVNVPWQIINGKTLKNSFIDNIMFKDNTHLEENIEIFDAPQITGIQFIDDNKIKIKWINHLRHDFKPSIQPMLLIKSENDEMKFERIYNLNMKSVELYDDYAIIDIDKVRESSPGSIFGQSMGEMAEPYQVFETFYIGGEYAFEVYFNDNDKEYQFTGASTGGVFPNKEYNTIKIEGSTLLEGDRLLLEKEYESALKWFENRVKTYPEDKHSLNILSAIYHSGYKMEYENKEERKGKIVDIGKDFDKAMKYSEMLLELDQDRNIINRLGYIYRELDMEEEYFEISQKLIDEYEEYYNYKVVSRYYIKKGQMSQGFDAIKLFNEKYKSKYKGYSEIIMMSLILNDQEELEKYIPLIIRDYDGLDCSEELKYYIKMNKDGFEDFFNKLNNNNLKDAEKMLENDESDLGIFYKGIITLLKREKEFRKEYPVLYKQQNDQKLKRIMKYFGQCEIQSNFDDELYWRDFEY